MQREQSSLKKCEMYLSLFTRYPSPAEKTCRILLALLNFSLLHVGRSSTVKIHVMWSSNTCMAFGITFGCQGRFCSAFTWRNHAWPSSELSKKRRLNQSWSVGLQLNLSCINKSRLTFCLIDVNLSMQLPLKTWQTSPSQRRANLT